MVYFYIQPDRHEHVRRKYKVKVLTKFYVDTGSQAWS